MSVRSIRARFEAAALAAIGAPARTIELTVGSARAAPAPAAIFRRAWVKLNPSPADIASIISPTASSIAPGSRRTRSSRSTPRRASPSGAP